MINDLAEMFKVSRTAVMANLERLGAESRRGIVNRRIEEARLLYQQGMVARQDRQALRRLPVDRS